MSTARTAVSAAGSASGAIGTAVGSAWIPIVGPALAAVTLLFMARKRPGQKRATTQIVDELEPLLQQNRAAYFEGPRTAASKEAALANFDAAMAELQQACGAPEYGSPGRACIADRIRGGRWDWYAMYRDPIEAAATTDQASGPRLDSRTALIAAALIAAAVIL
jgi:hypothetical protein